MSRRSIIALVVIFILFVIFLAITAQSRNDFEQAYNKGVEQLENGNIEEAIRCFRDIPNCTEYLDIKELLENAGVDLCPSCGYILSDE